jgi:hypothetical protein
VWNSVFNGSSEYDAKTAAITVGEIEGVNGDWAITKRQKVRHKVVKAFHGTKVWIT